MQRPLNQASPRARGLRALGRGKLVLAGALSLAGCNYNVVLGSVTTYRITALQCGTWDSLGVHTQNEYFVGHSAARPNDTLSYFVFDLSSIQGKTIVAANVTIPGTPDWRVTVPEPGSTTVFDFKLGITPLPASLTLAQVLGGASNSGSNDGGASDAGASDAGASNAGANGPGVYPDVRQEQDLGFGWVPSGATTNTYDAFHYDNSRLQRAVDAGGTYALFAVERFADTAATEEYLYGGGTCGPGTILTVEAE